MIHKAKKYQFIICLLIILLELVNSFGNLRVFYDNLNWTNIYSVKSGEQLLIPYNISEIFYIELVYQTEQKSQKSICSITQRSVKIEPTRTIQAAVKESQQAPFSEVFLFKDKAFVTTQKGKIVILLLGMNRSNQIVIRKQVSLNFATQSDSKKSHQLVYCEKFNLLLFIFNNMVMSLPIVENLQDLSPQLLNQMEGFKSRNSIFQVVCYDDFLYIACGDQGIDIYYIQNQAQLNLKKQIDPSDQLGVEENETNPKQEENQKNQEQRVGFVDFDLIIFNNKTLTEQELQDFQDLQEKEESEKVLNQISEELQSLEITEDNDGSDQMNEEEQEFERVGLIKLIQKKKQFEKQDEQVIHVDPEEIEAAEEGEGEQIKQAQKKKKKQKDIPQRPLLLFALQYEKGLHTFYMPQGNPKKMMKKQLLIESKQSLKFAQNSNGTILVLSKSENQYLLTEYQTNLLFGVVQQYLKQYQQQQIQQIIISEQFSILTQEKTQPYIFWHSIVRENQKSQKYLGFPFITNAPITPRLAMGSSINLPRVDQYLQYEELPISSSSQENQDSFGSEQNKDVQKEQELIVDDEEREDDLIIEGPILSDDDMLSDEQDEELEQQDIMEDIQLDEDEKMEIINLKENNKLLRKNKINIFQQGSEDQQFHFMFAYSHYSDNKVFIAPFQIEFPFMICNASNGGFIKSLGKEYRYTSIVQTKSCDKLKEQIGESVSDDSEQSFCELSHTFNVVVEKNIKKQQELEIGILIIILIFIIVFFLAYQYKRKKFRQFDLFKKDFKSKAPNIPSTRKKRFDLQYQPVSDNDN